MIGDLTEASNSISIARSVADSQKNMGFLSFNDFSLIGLALADLFLSESSSAR
jgi:hypothetical protein